MATIATSPGYFIVRDDYSSGSKYGLVCGVLGKYLATDSLPVAVATYGANVTSAYVTISAVGAPVALMGAALARSAGPVCAPFAYGLLAGGGLEWWFDGDRISENGFLVDPYCGAVFNTISPLAAGQWAFRTVYQWFDGYGQVHRSAPSAAVIATTDGTQGLVLSCPMLTLTNRDNAYPAPVQIQFYAQYPGDAVFYLQGTVNNDVTQSLATFQQPQTFSRISQLYTTGSDGELANESVPAVAVQAASHNRIYVVPAEDPNAVWISKERVTGFPAEFSSFMVKRCDERGGPITAVYPMDEKTIVFKRTSILYFVGGGPADNGTNDDTSSVIQIASDVGAISQESVVLMPLGLMFKSAKGFYLLDRSLQARYIGSGAEAFNAANVTSASLATTSRQVRFTTDAGYVLVYNYNFDAWSREVAPSPLSFLSGATVNDRQVLVAGSGTYRLWVETPGVYQDINDNVAVSLGKAVTTGWISFAEIDGFQRVRRMMLLFGPNSSTSSVYTISVYYDFDDAAVDTVTVPASSLHATSEGDQLMVHLSRQKCSAIKVGIAETTPGADPGIRLSALSFEVGVKRGLAKLPPAKKVGTA